MWRTVHPTPATVLKSDKGFGGNFARRDASCRGHTQCTRWAHAAFAPDCKFKFSHKHGRSRHLWLKISCHWVCLTVRVVMLVWALNRHIGAGGCKHTCTTGQSHIQVCRNQPERWRNVGWRVWECLWGWEGRELHGAISQLHLCIL